MQPYALLCLGKTRHTREQEKKTNHFPALFHKYDTTNWMLYDHSIRTSTTHRITNLRSSVFGLFAYVCVCVSDACSNLPALVGKPYCMLGHYTHYIHSYYHQDWSEGRVRRVKERKLYFSLDDDKIEFTDLFFLDFRHSTVTVASFESTPKKSW